MQLVPPRNVFDVCSGDPSRRHASGHLPSSSDERNYERPPLRATSVKACAHFEGEMVRARLSPGWTLFQGDRSGQPFSRNVHAFPPEAMLPFEKYLDLSELRIQPPAPQARKERSLIQKVVAHLLNRGQRPVIAYCSRVQNEEARIGGGNRWWNLAKLDGFRSFRKGCPRRHGQTYQQSRHQGESDAHSNRPVNVKSRTACYATGHLLRHRLGPLLCSEVPLLLPSRCRPSLRPDKASVAGFDGRPNACLSKYQSRRRRAGSWGSGRAGERLQQATLWAPVRRDRQPIPVSEMQTRPERAFRFSLRPLGL